MSDIESSVDIFKGQSDDENLCKDVFANRELYGWSPRKKSSIENMNNCTYTTCLSDTPAENSEERLEEEHEHLVEVNNNVTASLDNDSNIGLSEELNNCKWTKFILETPMDKEETPLELLPPDHPLLRKFQNSLKEHLVRAKEQLIGEIDKLKYNLKLKEQERENCGATLYDMQNEIDRQNEQLEDFTIQIEEHVEKRRKEEEVVLSLKTECDRQTQLLKDQKNHYNQRMVDLEHMQVLELNIRKWANEVEDELKNAQRVVSRDDQLQKQLSEDKKKSDLLLYHLDSEIKKSQKELQLLRNESEDMKGVLDSLRMSTADANADLEALEDGHKNLSQAWGEVIVAISLRDRILYQAQTDMKKINEEIKNHASGIEAAHKLIKRELKLNEKLMVFKKNLADSLGGLRNQCKQQSDILSGLERSLLEIPAILAITEEEMKIARNEGLAIERELRRLQTAMDQWNNKKFLCEDGLLKLAQDQLINDKASVYRVKLIRNAQETRRGLELTLAQSQNQLATVLLQIEHYKSRISKYIEESNGLETHYGQLEAKANEITRELKRIELDIDLRMKRMEKLNNQIENVKKSGGTMSTGTELKIKLEEKIIQEIEIDIRKAQELWIMLQNHYVNLTDKRNVQLNEVQITKKQLSIIKQKSIKLDLELEKADENARDINREIRNQRKILEQMDMKIHKKQKEQETEEKELEHEHDELIERLKANEMEVLRLEEKINDLNSEIGHFKDIVLAKHRESLSWETKYKLIEETLLWRKDENAAQSEITTMRKEIHRMQIRYQQLRRVQEKLNQDLDHGVMHREHMFILDSTKKNIESQKKQVKQSSQTLRHRINDLRGKLKHQESQFEQTRQQIDASEKEIKEIEVDVRNLNKIGQEAMNDMERLKLDIENATFRKHINLEKIVRIQSRAKWYKHLSRFTVMDNLVRSETTINTLWNKQQDIKKKMMEILQMMKDECPDRSNDFNKLFYVLQQD